MARQSCENAKHEGECTNIEGLTPEQQEKVKGCSTPEEMLALAQEEGYELSDEQLEAVSGGWKEPCATLYYCKDVQHVEVEE